MLTPQELREICEYLDAWTWPNQEGPGHDPMPMVNVSRVKILLEKQYTQKASNVGQ